MSFCMTCGSPVATAAPVQVHSEDVAQSVGQVRRQVLPTQVVGLRWVRSTPPSVSHRPVSIVVEQSRRDGNAV